MTPRNPDTDDHGFAKLTPIKTPVRVIEPLLSAVDEQDILNARASGQISDRDIALWIAQHEAEGDGYWCITEALAENRTPTEARKRLIDMLVNFANGDDAELGRIVRENIREYNLPKIADDWGVK